jgi:hypothetical protein
MPTFKFYWMGKERDSFSGADGRRIASTTAQLAKQAATRGTFVNQEVTAASLKVWVCGDPRAQRAAAHRRPRQAFYTKHEPSKAGDDEAIRSTVRKYRGKVRRPLGYTLSAKTLS